VCTCGWIDSLGQTSLASWGPLLPINCYTNVQFLSILQFYFFLLGELSPACGIGEGIPCTALASILCQWFKMSQTLVKSKPPCGLLPEWQLAQRLAKICLTCLNVLTWAIVSTITFFCCLAEQRSPPLFLLEISKSYVNQSFYKSNYRMYLEYRVVSLRLF
jgi:preprotein translocase subunit SecY